MSWDESLFRAINTLVGHVPFLDHGLIAVGWRSTFYIPICLAAAYWIWINWRGALMGGVALAGVIGVADLIAGNLKHVVQRPRPCVALSGITALEQPCGGLFSFPSNHAVNTAAAAAFLHMLYPRSGWVSWPVVALVGFARVYVGAHYVTDVLGGWAIGGVLGAGVAWALLRWPYFGRSLKIANLSRRPASNG